MRWRGSSTLTVTWLLAASCGISRDHGSSVGYGDVFVEVGRIELQESPDDPIVAIDHVSRRPGGGFLIADRHAGRVRLFDEAGRQIGIVGKPGQGPGELEEPSGAVEFPDGRLIVVQRASPRLTIFSPDTAPVIGRVPGQYGFWAARAGDGFVAGVATRDTRFAVFDPDGTPPRDWVPVSAPPISDLSAPGSRERLEQWSRSFTVVRRIAAVADSVLVVEYGRHDPREGDPYFVVPTTVDVYSADGQKLAEGLNLPGPVVGGGPHLLLLAAEPPNAWTVSVLEWRGPQP